MYRTVPSALVFLLVFGLVLGCEDDDEPKEAPDEGAEPAQAAAEEPEEAPEEAPDDNPDIAESLPNGLLLAYAQFQVDDGRVTAKPGPARLELLYKKDGRWRTEAIEDPESNVFHKAMVYEPPEGKPSILTASGMAAAVKLWHKREGEWKAETLWEESFGGKFDRMRDIEVADVYGDGKIDIAVGTHDQGVVAMLRPGDEWKVERIDEKEDTFIHEIEIGDLNEDGALEVYATPSDPNRLEGDARQHGKVVRYVPKEGNDKTVVAELGERHAKEIYVGDVDGDGTDELYVAVEALTERGDDDKVKIVEPVEIRRYDAKTKPDEGVVVATLPDRFTRFLTVGDLDGDGQKEMVAAAFRSGVWQLTPGEDPEKEWKAENIDEDSSGFEHAAVVADLDDDGTDELYVAADEQGELRRYTWQDGEMSREVIHRRPIAGSMMTWNLVPFPVGLLE
ncbi:MAG: FG-GAP repeat domain-containing protein [Myxococcota bacterium]